MYANVGQSGLVVNGFIGDHPLFRKPFCDAVQYGAWIAPMYLIPVSQVESRAPLPSDGHRS